MRFLATLAGIAAFASLTGRAVDVELGPAPAGAHLVRVQPKPARSVLELRAAAQRENLAHARYVCAHGGGLNKRWHCTARRWIDRELNETLNLLRPASSPNVQETICGVFGAYCSQAIRVAHCETGGTFDTHAANGQYLGLFQMGSTERATYGHGPSALEQAQAAYRYFKVSGRDWSPWDPRCKP